MRRYIAIDGGTSNTRLYYLSGTQVLGVEKLTVGVRDAAQDTAVFRNSIRQRITKLVNAFGRPDLILVAGMLTSELGIYHLPHISAPAGIQELHDAMRQAILPDISEFPFYFIPGVKLAGYDIAHTDMMRGEECELVGLWDESCADAVFILPGSHSKLIQCDDTGRIIDFVTLLSGEMVSALSAHTILKNSVDLDAELNPVALMDGYRYAAQNGLNEALFKVRVLSNALEADRSRCSSFFLGAILSGEINRLLSINCSKILICGQQNLKNATFLLLSQLTKTPVAVVDDSRGELAVVNGMVKIFEYGGENVC